MKASNITLRGIFSLSLLFTMLSLVGCASDPSRSVAGEYSAQNTTHEYKGPTSVGRSINQY
jgi:curli biogenesis system outer membrane secretion channel CsgG